MKRKKNVLFATVMLFSVSSQALLAFLDPAQDQQCEPLKNSQPSHFFTGFFAQLINPFGLFGSPQKKITACTPRVETQTSQKTNDDEKSNIPGSSVPASFLDENASKKSLESSSAKSIDNKVEYLEKESTHQRDVPVTLESYKETNNVVKSALDSTQFSLDTIEKRPIAMDGVPQTAASTVESGSWQTETVPTSEDFVVLKPYAMHADEPSPPLFKDPNDEIPKVVPVTADVEEPIEPVTLPLDQTSLPLQDLLFNFLWKFEEGSVAIPERRPEDEGQSPGIYAAEDGQPYYKLNFSEETSLINFMSTYSPESAVSLLEKYGDYLTLEQREAAYKTIGILNVKPDLTELVSHLNSTPDSVDALAPQKEREQLLTRREGGDTDKGAFKKADSLKSDWETNLTNEVISESQKRYDDSEFEQPETLQTQAQEAASAFPTQDPENDSWDSTSEGYSEDAGDDIVT